MYDRNHGTTTARFDHNIAILHGTGRYSVYGHLRKGDSTGAWRPCCGRTNRWTVGGKLVRAVQSAAVSDVLRKGAALSGKEVRCTVTAGDGRLSGRPASVSAVARG